MGNSESSIKKVNFDDIINISKDSKESTKNTHILIHVMEKEDQELLIKNTLSIDEEIEIINSILSFRKMDVIIVIYGKNTDDVSKVIRRYRQLCDMGFSNVHVYFGGLFEWLLLQEIYGNDDMKTNIVCNRNILDYKPARGL